MIKNISKLCDEAEGLINIVHSADNLTNLQKEQLNMACDCINEIREGLKIKMRALPTWIGLEKDRDLVVINKNEESIYVVIDANGGIAGIYSTLEGSVKGGLTEDEVKTLRWNNQGS